MLLFSIASTIPRGTCTGFILECLMTGFSRFKKEFLKKFMYLWQMRCRSDEMCDKIRENCDQDFLVLT